MHKVIFLDRDGCINVGHSQWWKKELFILHDGVSAALRLLKDDGYKLALVTNQGGVAKGLYTEAEVNDLHDHLQKLLDQEGVALDTIAYCPHYTETECNCRKPRPGMAKQIEEQLGKIDYANSWMIGDKETDIGFGHNNGTKTALIRSRYWQDQTKLKSQPTLIVNSLFDFAQRIVNK